MPVQPSSPTTRKQEHSTSEISTLMDYQECSSWDNIPREGLNSRWGYPQTHGPTEKTTLLSSNRAQRIAKAWALEILPTCLIAWEIAQSTLWKAYNPVLAWVTSTSRHRPGKCQFFCLSSRQLRSWAALPWRNTLIFSSEDNYLSKLNPSHHWKRPPFNVGLLNIKKYWMLLLELSLNHSFSLQRTVWL